MDRREPPAGHWKKVLAQLHLRPDQVKHITAGFQVKPHTIRSATNWSVPSYILNAEVVAISMLAHCCLLAWWRRNCCCRGRSCGSLYKHAILQDTANTLLQAHHLR